MSYPQPDSNEPALDGLQFFRLRTTLVSDGDIYESEQGANGLMIGPNSDISRVIVAYFDESAPSFQNSVTVTAAAPFAGKIAARNDASYSPSSRPGRILIYPDELFNANYQPSGFDSGGGRVDFVTPVLDVVEFFAPPAFTGKRNDKNYQLQLIPWPGNLPGQYYLVVPFYGRRYASINFANNTNQNVSFSVLGVNYNLAGSTGQIGVETSIVAPTVVNAGGSGIQREILASTSGMFDALVVGFVPAALPNTASTPIRILVSDQEK